MRNMTTIGLGCVHQDDVTLPKTSSWSEKVATAGKDSSPVVVEGMHQAPKKRTFGLLGTIIGECLCEPFTPPGEHKGLSPSAQFIELHGIQFIGLGAVIDELTAKERVYDTLEQLTSRTERMISIGYLIDDDEMPGRKLTEVIPLDIWSKTYPNDRNMSRTVRNAIAHMKSRDFDQALRTLKKEFESQKVRPLRNNNLFMQGITAHNIGVIYVLAGQGHTAVKYFKEAVALKTEAFGSGHPEIAISLDELGIQLFAKDQFEGALAAFNESRKIFSQWYGSTHPRLAMILNNIACCSFAMGNGVAALLTINEASDLQKERNENSSAKADLDLLHMAILLNNSGYLRVSVKQYDEARSCFEEALLIQQSVLGDAYDHRAIHDSRKNLEFTNAFHS